MNKILGIGHWIYCSSKSFLITKKYFMWRIAAWVSLLLMAIIACHEMVMHILLPYSFSPLEKIPQHLTQIMPYFYSQAVLFVIALIIIVAAEKYKYLHLVPHTPMLFLVLCGAGFSTLTFTIGSNDLYDYITFGRKLGILHSTPYEPRAALAADPIMALVPRFWFGVPSPYGPTANLLYAFLNIVSPEDLPSLVLVFKIAWFVMFQVFALLFYYVLKEGSYPYSRWFALCANPMFWWLCLRDAHIELLMLIWLAGAIITMRKKYWFSTGVLLALLCSTKIVMIAVVPFFIWYIFSQGATSEGIQKIKKTVLGFAAYVCPLYLVFNGAELSAVMKVASNSSYCAQMIPHLFNVYLSNPPYSRPDLSTWLAIRMGNIFALTVLACLFFAVIRRRQIFNLFMISGLAMAAVFYTRSYFMPWYVLWCLPLLILGTRGGAGIVGLTAIFTFIVAPNYSLHNYCASSYVTQIAAGLAAVIGWTYLSARSSLEENKGIN